MNRFATIHEPMDSMIQAIKTLHAQNEQYADHFDLGMYLSEFRTMGFHVPRQCGATSWLMKHFVSDPDALMIIRPDMRKMIYGNFNCHGELRRDLPLPGPDLTRDQLSRMVSPIEIGTAVSQARVRQARIPLLLIDDSSVFFDRVRHRKFYDWLAAGPGVDQNTVIIRMN